jgi:hypothetical protein
LPPSTSVKQGEKPLSWPSKPKLERAKFSFARDGKGGTPFSVDRTTYDSTIQTLHDAIEEAKLGKER